MTPLIVVSVIALLGAGPAVLLIANLWSYRSPQASARPRRPKLSVLIPARNEERNIAEAISSVLDNRDVDLELLVLDDHSEDRTVERVEVLARGDDRVRLLRAPPLPKGYNGKQHACAILAANARHELLVFMDADVRLDRSALAKLAGFMDESGADLASGVPHQQLGTTVERLLVPLIHFLLLAFLPLGRMRRSQHPAYGAGVGQLFVARRGSYWQAGGHLAIRSSRHDGIALPRAFREAGLRTDLFDADAIATCRMYQSAGETYEGLLKNADEGLASPKAILPASLVLGLGQIAPWVVLGATLPAPSVVTVIASATVVVTLGARIAAARRFRQPLAVALAHPLAIGLFLLVQWHALARLLAGAPAEWKGRSYYYCPTSLTGFRRQRR